jgi:large subunit ribosomal protein L25
MAEAAKLEAKPRAEKGSRAMSRLRRHGRVPGVVYGHKEDVLSVTVDHDDMAAVIRHGQRVVDLLLDGKSEKCLVKEVQWDAIGRDVLHVDFARVSLDERIRVTVPIQLRGTPAGVTAGGVLEQPLHTLEIECLAINVPDFIRVNVQDLQLEQAIHVKDVVPPPDVKIFGDPDAVVVHVVKPKEEAAPVAAEAAGPAEPEVITKGVKEKDAEAE